MADMQDETPKKNDSASKRPEVKMVYHVNLLCPRMPVRKRFQADIRSPVPESLSNALWYDVLTDSTYYEPHSGQCADGLHTSILSSFRLHAPSVLPLTLKNLLAARDDNEAAARQNWFRRSIPFPVTYPLSLCWSARI